MKMAGLVKIHLIKTRIHLAFNNQHKPNGYQKSKGAYLRAKVSQYLEIRKRIDKILYNHYLTMRKEVYSHANKREFV